MTELVLTIIGRDRAGIVAALADVVRFHEGDWKRSELAEIAGTFAGVVVVAVDDEQVDGLLASLVVLREQGVHVTAQPIEGPTTAPSDVEVHVLLSGADRPGVVRDISAALSELGVNIERMGTVTGLPGDDGASRFEFTARLSVPVDVGLDAMNESLDATADRLGITFEVTDITGEDGDD